MDKTVSLTHEPRYQEEFDQLIKAIEVAVVTRMTYGDDGLPQRMNDAILELETKYNQYLDITDQLSHYRS